MNKFTTSSKPKVVYFGNKTIESDTIELVSVSKLDIKDLIELNPDLIITDDCDSILYMSPYELRRRWILYDSISDIYSQAVQTGFNKVSISVFTSIYNTDKFQLLNAYRSLLLQTYKNWEWVIVDDGDIDNSGLIESIGDPRIKYYRFNKQTGGNIGEAKYRAATLCNGNILVELDHDDELINDCLELLVSAFSNPDIGFVYSDCVEYDSIHNRNKLYGNNFSFGFSNHYVCGKYMPYNPPPVNPLTIRHILSVPNHVRAWRSSVYHSIGGHNRSMRICDDYELIVRTFLNTKFMYIPKMLYIQNFHSSNSQDSNRNDIQLRVREVVKYYDNEIYNRFKYFGIEDPVVGMTAIDYYTKYFHRDLISCNEIFDLNTY